jgi:DNA-binding transcriptional LysR family regulator
VTAPTAFGRKHIAPHLAAFIAEHPNLAITVHLSERLVDLKNERFDLAIRIADMKSADLIAARPPATIVSCAGRRPISSARESPRSSPTCRSTIAS